MQFIYSQKKKCSLHCADFHGIKEMIKKGYVQIFYAEIQWNRKLKGVVGIQIHFNPQEGFQGANFHENRNHSVRYCGHFFYLVSS